MSGCQTNQQFSPQQAHVINELAEQWRRDSAQMEREFPAENLGTIEARREAARPLVVAYLTRRAAVSNFSSIIDLESTVNLLAETPVVMANGRRAAVERELIRLRQSRAEIDLAELDNRQVTNTDIARITRRRSGESSEQPALFSRAQRETELRNQIIQRRALQASRNTDVRERELTRLASSNLADMPREISRAAEENLLLRRSPFDVRPSWRPSNGEVREEESRIRESILRRQESDRRDAQSRAQAEFLQAQREAIIRSCQTQAALIGASVPSPYMGRGLGGALASGLAGAVQQAATENNALQSCLRSNGI